jgi:hypothetical protein
MLFECKYTVQCECGSVTIEDTEKAVKMAYHRALQLTRGGPLSKYLITEIVEPLTNDKISPE